jgi:hypothetical protein
MAQTTSDTSNQPVANQPVANQPRPNQPGHNAPVNITIDGNVYSVPPGTKSLAGLMKECPLDPGVKKLTLVSAPTQPYVMGPNDSYDFVGGEVFTSDHNPSGHKK